MKVGDLVQWTLNEIPPRRGVIIGFDDERSGQRLRVGGLEDQATIQVMWANMKIRWECPLDIEVINESR
ncbi:MAG TPA: hypothetical protein EYF95_04145 [Flavobacteriales bacterium]|jgi:hypothetical protein|nr:hypothetical protein [Flavobacteriales bacterium]